MENPLIVAGQDVLEICMVNHLIVFAMAWLVLTLERVKILISSKSTGTSMADEQRKSKILITTNPF